MASPAAVLRTRKRKRRGCIYTRYSTRDQHSTEDQIRKCQEWAELNDIEIVEIFSDEGRSGRTHKRPGLQAMLAGLRAGKFDVVVVFATNRLFRKVYSILQFVAEDIRDHNRRCVFVAQNLDTDNPYFDSRMKGYADMDQSQVEMIKPQVQAANEGRLMRRLIHSTISFGFCGVPVDCRRRRNGQTDREWGMDKVSSKWVIRAFQWYVNEELTYAEIARRFRAGGAPPPPRCKEWSWRAIKYLLQNRRYIGDFSYGVTEAIMLNKAGYIKQVKREKPLKEMYFEDFRLVDDVLFYAAQERSATNKGRGGRRKGQVDGPPHVLKDLLWCGYHDHQLNTMGMKMMVCLHCKAKDDQHLYSCVNRDLAIRMICGELSRRLQQNDELVQRIITAAQAAAEGLQRPGPEQVQQLEREIEKLDRQIKFILRTAGDNEADEEENQQALATARSDRAVLQKKLAELKDQAELAVTVPTEAQVRELISKFTAVLIAAADHNDPESVAGLRRVLHTLTGGRIVMSQQGEKKAKRGWLRGTFTLRLIGVLSSELKLAGVNEVEEIVHIDFCAPSMSEELADKVKQMFEDGMLIKDIADELQVGRNTVGKALRHWYISRGEPLPDLVRRRAGLTIAKHPPKYQLLADEAKRLLDEGLLLHDIAQRLKMDRNTLETSLRWWHEQRGLPYVDGRTRRKTLPKKSA